MVMRAILLGTGGLLCVLALFPILLIGQAVFFAYLMHAPRRPADPYINPHYEHFYFVFGGHQIDAVWALGGAALIAFSLIAAGIWLLKAGWQMQRDSKTPLQ